MSLFLRAWKGHSPQPVPCFVFTTDRTETLVLSLRMPQPDANRPEENHYNDETKTDTRGVGTKYASCKESGTRRENMKN